ncbi:MAG: HAMP domain-containing protein, partial [Desulfovibrionaceae bacterium]|nr:HAMP domain-containing protein [Desulfovibrionaceae bacterium]
MKLKEMPGLRLLKLPDSLFGQLLCLLFVGILILQAANFYVVCSVQAIYVHQLEKSRAENLVTYWFMFNSMSEGQRRKVLLHMADHERPEKLREMVEILPEAPNWKDGTPQVGRLIALVEKCFGSDMSELPEVAARRQENGTGIFPMHLPVLETAVRLSDGTWLKVTQPFNVDDRNVVWTQRFFVLLEAIIILLLMGCLLLRVTRPLRDLGIAAETFGRHPEASAPLPEHGVREVREAAQSFNHMRERICGNLAERDRMIAAMAHDLRTPLTRLQLRLDRVEPEDLRQKLQDAATDMQAIIKQGLELARSMNTEEPMTRLDVRAFIQSVGDDYADVGRNVTVSDTLQNLDGPLVVNARPLCLKRCLENLVSNACKYGGSAEISLERKNGSSLI